MALRAISWPAAALVALILAASPVPGGTAECADCDGDGSVRIGDLITGINIALGQEELSACSAVDRGGDGMVTIADLIAAIGDALNGCQPNPDPTPTPDSQLPPTEVEALRAWLQAGTYLDWQAESAPHTGAGPHFGVVRAFVNDALFASLGAGAAQHPAGAAAVKELYGRNSPTPLGWAVMVKVQDDSDLGNGWYWLETFGSFTGGGVGNPGCTGCHAAGKDFVLIPFPLQ